LLFFHVNTGRNFPLFTIQDLLATVPEVNNNFQLVALFHLALFSRALTEQKGSVLDCFSLENTYQLPYELVVVVAGQAVLSSALSINKFPT